MGMSRKLTRRVATRNVKSKIYIFAEGKNTEPKYFEAYARIASKTTKGSIVEVLCEKERGNPTTLLRLAKEKRKQISSRFYRSQNGENDQAWIVFDQDEHPNIPDVINESRNANIEVAYSAPCFEVWLILHVTDYDRDEHRHATQKFCESVCAGYESTKGKTPELEALIKNVESAEARARAQYTRRKADKGNSPMTSVFRLIEAIRGDTPTDLDSL